MLTLNLSHLYWTKKLNKAFYNLAGIYTGGVLRFRKKYGTKRRVGIKQKASKVIENRQRETKPKIEDLWEN